MFKTALITGITGQDGAYLARFLLDRGYRVFGTFRRLSTPNFWRLQYLDIFDKVNLIPADLVDAASLVEAIKLSRPDEIYAGANVYDADDERDCGGRINGNQKVRTSGKNSTKIEGASHHGAKSGPSSMPCPDWLHPGSGYSISPADSLLPYDKKSGLRRFHLD